MTTDLNAMQGARDSSGAKGAPLGDARDWDGSTTPTSTAMNDETSSPTGGRKYERKTKRFAWPDDLHRLFVAAIFDLGLKNASPKALMPFMQPTADNAGLTTEHLKSHLQKYRLNYDKSRAEFLAFFDESARRNGRRRRRSAKTLQSHTRFIFPIQPTTGAAANQEATGSSAPSDQVPRITLPDAALQSPVYADRTFSPRSRLQRAHLLRLAQQNAATALAAAASSGSVPTLQPMGYPTGISPRPVDGPSADGVTDAQWNILASLLSPQVGATTAPQQPPAFSLGDSGSPELQMQMHLAMQAQMNLHRQMLTRKVAVSQNYYNQAAAVKRAAASAMVERALQNITSQQSQGQPGRYAEVTPSARPSIGADINTYSGQQSMYQQQEQRYAASVTPLGGSLPQPDPMSWDPMDISMEMTEDDQSDLFSFLKSTE